jgi:2-iminobutanoate/2-iminopropanoate deaminase
MKKIISTDKAPEAIGPYSQAIQFSGLLFVSGQIAIDPKTGEFVEGDIEAHTEQVLENLKAIIEEAGMTLKDVLKCSCFLKNMKDFVAFNGVYFGGSFCHLRGSEVKTKTEALGRRRVI